MFERKLRQIMISLTWIKFARLILMNILPTVERNYWVQQTKLDFFTCLGYLVQTSYLATRLETYICYYSPLPQRLSY
jgi:hypothetical protein